MTLIFAAVVAQLADLATYSVAVTLPYGHEAGALAVVSPQQVVIVKAFGIAVVIGALMAFRYRLHRLYWVGLAVLGLAGLLGAATNIVNGGLL